MPKGPHGQKRPGDVIGAAIMVGRIASGEIEDNAKPADKADEADKSLLRIAGREGRHLRP